MKALISVVMFCVWWCSCQQHDDPAEAKINIGGIAPSRETFYVVSAQKSKYVSSGEAKSGTETISIAQVLAVPGNNRIRVNLKTLETGKGGLKASFDCDEFDLQEGLAAELGHDRKMAENRDDGMELHGELYSGYYNLDLELYGIYKDTDGKELRHDIVWDTEPGGGYDLAGLIKSTTPGERIPTSAYLSTGMPHVTGFHGNLSHLGAELRGGDQIKDLPGLHNDDAEQRKKEDSTRLEMGETTGLVHEDYILDLNKGEYTIGGFDLSTLPEQFNNCSSPSQQGSGSL